MSSPSPTSSTAKEPIPITVFTGFLGAGKTSVILSLLPQLPKDYKVVLLKNEFGDVEVDSKLAKESSLAAVAEIMNGCMCCVLVGQMQNALLEIRDNYRPDRIIIECSGSAFPATLAFQIRQLEADTQGDFLLDSIITVVDAENFMGYEDDSPTARMQASYSDLILINKWNLVTERALDIVMDHLYTLNDETPKVRCTPIDAGAGGGSMMPAGTHHTGITPSLIFGLHTALFRLEDSHLHPDQGAQHDDVETVTVDQGGIVEAHEHVHSGVCETGCNHNQDEEHKEKNRPATEHAITHAQLLQALAGLPADGTVYRVKGFVTLLDGEETGSKAHILNWAFGRHQLTVYEEENPSKTGNLRLSVMGARGEVRRATRRLAEAIGCTS